MKPKNQPKNRLSEWSHIPQQCYYTEMAQNLRRQVLDAFKSLHRARKRVFEGDDRALILGRQKINEEYRKCKNVSDQDAIKELIAHSRAVEKELIATVIQAREVSPGKYQVRLRDDVKKLDNVPFKDCPSSS